jgi:hypothetical protein
VRIIGIERIFPITADDHYLFKAIANESDAIFFPSTIEHRDAGQSSIRYADNYEGNALAAMIKPGHVEFRYHKQFSDNRVRKIAVELLSHPALAFAATFSVTYQNRLLVVGGEVCDTRE